MGEDNCRLQMPILHGFVVCIKNVGDIMINELSRKISGQATSKKYGIIKRSVVMYNAVYSRLRFGLVDSIVKVVALRVVYILDRGDSRRHVRENCAPDPIPICWVECAVIMRHQVGKLGFNVLEICGCRERIAGTRGQGIGMQFDELELEADHPEVAKKSGWKRVIRSPGQ